jgi:hypothetical protein
MTKPKTQGPKRHKQPPVPGGRPHRVRVQLTTEQLQVLQRLSDELYIGIPEILISSALDTEVRNPKVMAAEVAGIRRILTDESEQLRRIAILAEENRLSANGWASLQDSIEERNTKIAQHLGC